MGGEFFNNSSKINTGQILKGEQHEKESIKIHFTRTCIKHLPYNPAVVSCLCSLVQTTAPIDTEYNMQLLQAMVLPEQDRPEAVESYLVEQKGHVLRLRNEETNHNTVVFQNRDGNKTMYYFDQPVKYVDENGNIKDKKTTVTNVIDKAEYSADYGFVTSDNDIKTYFPKKLEATVYF